MTSFLQSFLHLTDSSAGLTRGLRWPRGRLPGHRRRRDIHPVQPNATTASRATSAPSPSGISSNSRRNLPSSSGRPITPSPTASARHERSLHSQARREVGNYHLPLFPLNLKARSLCLTCGKNTGSVVLPTQVLYIIVDTQPDLQSADNGMEVQSPRGYREGRSSGVPTVAALARGIAIAWTSASRRCSGPLGEADKGLQ